MTLPQGYTPAKRKAYKILFLLAVLMLLVCAAAVPFLWESKSLWYKLGIDRTMLQAGKVAGLIAAGLLFLQGLLAAKLVTLDKIFGLDRVFFFHHIIGFAIALLAIMHAGLILVPEGIDNLPVGWKFWPEMLGAVLLFSLISVVASTKIRGRILPYHIWRKIHRPAGYILTAVTAVHILNVSDSFEHDIPKYGVVSLLATVGAIKLFTSFFHARKSGRGFTLHNISPVNENILSLQVVPPSSFSYLPGQFAFLQLKGANISAEPHPFTIASSPSDTTLLQFYIKKCGDWTTDLQNAAGSGMALYGPFGLFSYLVKKQNQNLVFLAAGVGITPMISMLSHIAQQQPQPQARLIWSLRYEREMFLEEQIKQLHNDIKSFTADIIYTREHGGSRLNRRELETLLADAPRTSYIFLCGPQAMMTCTQKALVSLGFKKKQIFCERFSL